MRKSVFNKDQQREWQKMLTAVLNGCNVVYAEDFKAWSKKYNDLMQEKKKLFEKYSEKSGKTI